MILLVLAVIAFAVFGAIYSPKIIRHYRLRTAQRAERAELNLNQGEVTLTQEDVDEAFNYRPTKPDDGTTYRSPISSDYSSGGGWSGGSNSGGFNN